MKRGITLSDLSGMSEEVLKTKLVARPTEAEMDLPYGVFTSKFDYAPFIYQSETFILDNDDHYVYSDVVAYNVDTEMTMRQILDGESGEKLYYVLDAIEPNPFTDVTAKHASLGGTPQFKTVTDTLHIRGTFTPTGNIASGSKLFSTRAITARMTHGSAINSGTAGAEAFVGISIQTNGDVYCLGALTGGVAYSIAVTATL